MPLRCQLFSYEFQLAIYSRILFASKNLTVFSLSGSCKAVADTLQMLSEARHPRATGRRSRRQQKPSRLPVGELDDDASDYSDGISCAAEYSGGPLVSAPSLMPQEFMSSLNTPNTTKESGALKSDCGLQAMSVDAQERSRRNRSSAERAAAVSELGGIADFTTLLCFPCNKHFTTKFNLLRHAKRHVPAKRYKCTKCDFSGPDKAACLDHVHQCHAADDSVPLTELGAFIVDSIDGSTAQPSSSPRASELPAVAPCRSGDAMIVDPQGTFSAVSTSTVEGASDDSNLTNYR